MMIFDGSIRLAAGAGSRDSSNIRSRISRGGNSGACSGDSRWSTFESVVSAGGAAMYPVLTTEVGELLAVSSCPALIVLFLGLTMLIFSNAGRGELKVCDKLMYTGSIEA
jgi:hypothetical protein